MADVVLTRQRIEPGKTEKLREWLSKVRERENEACETLESEGMASEAAFLEQTEDGDFLVYYMEAEDLEQAYEAYAESSHEIDAEHEDVLSDVLEESPDFGEFELFYHLRASV